MDASKRTFITMKRIGSTHITFVFSILITGNRVNILID